jgi:esterase/lipase
MKIVVFSLLILPLLCLGQYDPKLNEYQHFTIALKKDTINYHVYAKGDLQTKKGFIVFFHGSGSDPLLRITQKIDTIKSAVNGESKVEIQKSNMLYSSIPFDLDRIPQEYALILISKKGIPFVLKSENFKVPESFFKTESLDYRVWQGNEVIKDIIKNKIKNPQKVIVIGHSEGSNVVAKLGVINKQITHIGYWAGGANTQYYDFALSIRKDVQLGKISEEEGKKQLESLLNDVKNIENDPQNIEKRWLGHSYQRWSTFTEPPIENLLKIEKPIFVAVAALDQSVPIESSYLIPLEFIRHKKQNLTFKVYPEYDHSFNKPPKSANGQFSFEFMTVFEEFIKWAEN